MELPQTMWKPSVSWMAFTSCFCVCSRLWLGLGLGLGSGLGLGLGQGLGLGLGVILECHAGLYRARVILEP